MASTSPWRFTLCSRLLVSDSRLHIEVRDPTNTSPPDNELSVVGFPIEVGGLLQGSFLLSSIFSNINSVSSPGSTGKTGPLNFALLENHLKNSQVFQYDGSLTTPPCSQGVKWNVVKNPIYVDVATYRAAKGVMGFNSRFTQNQPGQQNLIEYACSIL